MKSVAVLGLGTMGSGMARRLLAAGFPLTVYNRTPSRAEAFAAQGASVAATPREAASRAEVIIAMLADDAASRSAWMGENGALAGARPGAVLIESSTLSTHWVKELSAAAISQGCAFLDAPVTGSKPQAESGELLFLVGGESGALDSVRDVLAPMSRGAVHLGPTGSGALMKLINNFVCGVQAASLAEALGIDRELRTEPRAGGGDPGEWRPGQSSGAHARRPDGRSRLPAEFRPRSDGQGPDIRSRRGAPAGCSAGYGAGQQGCI